MLLIPCPHCGPRDESEFSYGGPATALPALDAAPTQWHTALHLRQYAEEIEELWFHEAGCERWLSLRRNLRSHDFHDPANPHPEETS